MASRQNHDSQGTSNNEHDNNVTVNLPAKLPMQTLLPYGMP